jgi:hypothetical protein
MGKGKDEKQVDSEGTRESSRVEEREVERAGLCEEEERGGARSVQRSDGIQIR